VAVFVLGAGATRGASFVGSGQNPCLPPLDADFFQQLQRIESAKHAATIERTLRDLDELFGHTHGLTLETASRVHDYLQSSQILLSSQSL
jgi:hypothetical protein